MLPAAEIHQLAHGLFYVGLAHEAFADEHRMHAGIPQACDIFAGADAAFAHDGHAVGDLPGQAQRCFQIDFKRRQVAVVDTDQFRACNEAQSSSRWLWTSTSASRPTFPAWVNSSASSLSLSILTISRTQSAPAARAS